MNGISQAETVENQFGPRAAEYLTSAVHAQGEDLAHFSAMLVEDGAGSRVLDMGCGGGHMSFAAAPFVREVVAYDLSPEMLSVVAHAAGERGLDNLLTEQGEAEALPFEDGSFDWVVSRFSAHHWTGWRAGLQEAHRVMRPGGRGVFIDVVSPGAPALDTYLQSVEVLRDTSHVRDYSAGEWEATLADSGFMVQATRRHRLRMDFTTWIARMRTPEVMANAIRALQGAMAEPVRRHFAIEADGSFMIDVATFEVVRGF
ncbi:class I SAM-dependent methyltransferase [Acidisoma silvae]|uniref:Methyltransferase domain-containing protein n=1 Tax=Acidisoma silvae TaxID=2802396 RepID=A0A964DZQ7_9PROT|nr:class I SAM-dependent methyltransferase [Acidisoma silvae]MCB8876556.1 methyltransferase domain-containing protein [Acidisoma silvae]